MFIHLKKYSNIEEYVFINMKDLKEVLPSTRILFYLSCPLAKSANKCSGTLLEFCFWAAL